MHSTSLLVLLTELVWVVLLQLLVLLLLCCKRGSAVDDGDCRHEGCHHGHHRHGAERR